MPFTLAICDLYHRDKYGFTAESSKNIHTHFIMYEYIDVEEFYDETNILITYMQDLWSLQHIQYANHEFLRNYQHYILTKKYNNIEIAETYILPGGEMVAILKTFWISIIQRCWRKTYQRRKYILQCRKMPTVLYYYEIHGKYPHFCNIWPKFGLGIK